MVLKKWVSKTSIGHWEVSIGILCMLAFLFIGCMMKETLVSTVDIGYIHSCRMTSEDMAYQETIIVTDISSVTIDGPTETVPIGAHAYVNRYTHSDYITWDGLKTPYKIKRWN
jgi:hypothetical protein